MPESANEHLEYLRQRLRLNPPKSILDVGVGRGNYGWFLRVDAKWPGRLTGMEVWGPYVVGPDALAGHNRTYYDGGILVMDMRSIEAVEAMNALRPDVIFAFDVIEHVSREEGIQVIRAMQRAARQAVLVCSPIVAYPQGAYLGNPYEAHKHDWTVQEFLALGSEMRGRGAATGLFEFPGGLCDRRVTVMLNTARGDESFKGRSILRTIAEDLSKQTFPSGELEFVVVDGLQDERFETFAEHTYPFRVLHVPPKMTSAMVREGRPAICAYKNTAIAHARGELLITIDDGCKLDSEFVYRCWDAWSTKKLCLGAMYRGLDDAGALLDAEHHNDSRGVYLDSTGECVGPIGGNVLAPPGQGFTAFPLQAALDLNGYDEMFDGSRGLEDTDFGARLQLSGQRIMLSRKHTVGVYTMGLWAPKLFGEGETAQTGVKCSQTTFRVRETREVRANTRAWSASEWAQIAPRCVHLGQDNCCTLFPPGAKCPYVGLCSDREHPGLQVLKDNPPIFDLGELRRANGIL